MMPLDYLSICLPKVAQGKKGVSIAGDLIK